MSKSVTIIGKAVFKDNSPIKGAKILIWEMDKKSADDVIVNDTTDTSSKFSETGFWKDGGLIHAPKYRYEIQFDGKVKAGKNILDNFFSNTLKTNWESPKQEQEREEKENVTITGQLIYKDKTPIVGASVKIWETDTKTADDIIVNTTSNAKGFFSGTGKWKDDGIIDTPTYRYEVNFEGEKITGKNILDKKFFEKLIS